MMEYLILLTSAAHNNSCTAFFARQHSRMLPEPENFMPCDKRVCCVLWRRVTCVAFRASANALAPRSLIVLQERSSLEIDGWPL